jgi:chromosome segregation ATPase
MKKLNNPVHVLLVLVIFFANLIGAFPSQALATDEKSTRRAQLMMEKLKQDMEAQISTMQAQFATEKKAYEDMINNQDETINELNVKQKNSESKIKYLNTSLVKSNLDKTNLEADLTKTKDKLDATETTLQSLQAEHTKTLADMSFNENQRKTLTNNLATSTKALYVCEEKNQKLYGYGKDLIQIYDHPSQYESMMRKENVFQLKRVELENLLQSNLDKLDEAHIVTTK